MQRCHEDADGDDKDVGKAGTDKDIFTDGIDNPASFDAARKMFNDHISWHPSMMPTKIVTSPSSLHQKFHGSISTAPVVSSNGSTRLTPCYSPKN